MHWSDEWTGIEEHMLSRGTSTRTHTGMKMPTSSGKGKGVCYAEGFSWRLAGHDAKSDAQLMKSAAGFDKDFLLKYS